MNCNIVLQKIAQSFFDNWECESVEGHTNRHLLITDALFPNNDCIEIMVEEHDDFLLVHDMCSVYNYLLLYGIDLYENKNKLETITGIFENYGLNFTNLQISRKTTANDLSQAVNSLIQGIKEAAFFHYTLRPHSRSKFKEKVYAFFASKRCAVNIDYAIRGFAREHHNIDIRLNSTNEILSKTISSTSSSQIQIQIERAHYIFDDTRKTKRQFLAAIFL